MSMVAAETVGGVVSRRCAVGAGEGGGRDDAKNTIPCLDCSRFMEC